MSNLHVNGQWITGAGEIFKSLNPVDKSIVWQGNEASVEQVNMAFEHAAQAFKSWSKTSFEYRLKILEKYRGLLERDKQSYAELISDETG